MAQLVLNASWVLVFFSLNAPDPALVVILVLLALIASAMKAFFPIDRTAG